MVKICIQLAAQQSERLVEQLFERLAQRYMESTKAVGIDVVALARPSQMWTDFGFSYKTLCRVFVSCAY